MKINRRSFYPAIFLIVILVCTVFFQNCSLDPEIGEEELNSKENTSSRLNDSSNQARCQIYNVTMDEDSLSFQIEGFEEILDIEDGDAFDTDDPALQKFLNNFHICSIFDSISKSLITNFTADDENSVTVSVGEEVPIKLSVNSETEDDDNLRLFSFATVQGDSDACRQETFQIHFVDVDEDDQIVLSDASNLECESIALEEHEANNEEDNEYSLDCTYTAPDLPECLFKLTLWSYDDEYVISTRRYSIQIEIEEN